MTTSVALLPEKCPHCGAPCRKEVLMRWGDNGWGDDASRTVFRYALAHRQDGELLALADRIANRSMEQERFGFTEAGRAVASLCSFIAEIGDELRTLSASPRGVDAYAAGWRNAAKWANRDDLLADVGSPAYERDKAAALSQPSGEVGNV